MCELAWHSCHDPACAQYRQIERPAVERGEPIGRLELLLQRMEEGGLHPGFGQEELRNAKPAVDGPCHGRRENVCARSARQPGRLGVDVSDVSWIWVESRQGEHLLAHRRDAERRAQLFEAARQLMASRRPGSRRRA